VISIENILKKIKNLPPFPEVYRKAIQLLQDPEISVDKLIEVIQYDQAITANVLRMCNSAYYRPSKKKIHSLREGLVLLGNKQLKEIISRSTIVKFYQNESKGYDLGRGELWKSAISSALISQLICKLIGKAEYSAIFTTTLLHDIGKVILNDFVWEENQRIFQLVQAKGYSFEEAEKKILGIDHAEVGAKIAELWHFPEDMIRAIRLHHTPEIAPEDDNMTPIVYLSDVITLTMGIGVGSDGLCYRANESIMKRFAVTSRDLQKIMMDFYEAYSGVQNILNLDE
jgi:putative nucleotidyltransferase with HDIG domain